MKTKINLKFLPNPQRVIKKSGELPIYLRIIIDGYKAEISTGVSCNPDSWDVQTERIKNKPNLNKNINDMDVLINNIIKRLEVEEKPITAKYLKRLIINKESSKKLLLDFKKEYYSKFVLNDAEKSEGTKKNYRMSYNHLENFFKDKKKETTPLSCIDLAIINDYDYWMINTLKIDRSSTAGHHKKFSSLLKQAVIQNELATNPYENYRIKRVKPNIVSLDREQLNLIENCNLNENKSLIECRDIFLFSVYTGLRIGQAMELSIRHIEYKSERWWLDIEKIQKTGEPLKVPFLQKAIDIIEKYRYIQEITGKVLPPRPHTKINEYLKVIGDLAGLKLRLHHHIARHTFCSTICLENDVPLEIASRLMAHRDIRSTLQYYSPKQSAFLNNVNKIDLALISTNENKMKVA